MLTSRQWLGKEVTLTDGATVTVDPSLGHHFYLETSGGVGRSLDMNGAGYAGKIITIECKNTHGSTTITHTLVTSGANDFRFPTGVNILNSIPPGVTVRTVYQYHAADSKWDLLADSGANFSSGNNRLINVDTIISSGYSMYVVGPLEIAAGFQLEIAAGACLEIG